MITLSPGDPEPCPRRRPAPRRRARPRVLVSLAIQALIAAPLLLLLLSHGARAEAAPRRVWIDVDTAMGLAGKDIDDALALRLALHDPELEVVGVSTVFGNAELEQTHTITTAGLRAEGSALKPARGRARPLGESLPSEPSEACAAMASALTEAPMTLLLLGPVTNAAELIRRHPALVARIEGIVAVAGRRPGEEFRVGRGRMPLRDLNFESDPEAFRVLLGAGRPIQLAPFRLATKVTLGSEVIGRVRRGDARGQELAKAMRVWAAFWRLAFRLPGFHPFDTLAVGLLTSGGFPSETLRAEISQGADGPELILGARGAPVTVGLAPAPGFRQTLSRRLARPPRLY